MSTGNIVPFCFRHSKRNSCFNKARTSIAIIYHPMVGSVEFSMYVGETSKNMR